MIKPLTDLQSGPNLLSKPQAEPGRKFTQPRDHFLAQLCKFSHHFGVVLVEGLHDVGDGVAAADGVGPLLPVQVLPSSTTTHLHLANLKSIFITSFTLKCS